MARSSSEKLTVQSMSLSLWLLSAAGTSQTTDDEILDWVQRAAETTYHPVGTCKMGSDPMAGVDAQLRVHGIEGLRVADASIMPTLTSGNTNAPSIMIGEKASRMVLAAGEEPAIPVDDLDVPVTVVAGEFDTMAPVEDMVALAQGIPGARLVRLPGTHFLPLQFPEVLREELEALRAR